jgi:monothiol glutaredoxin
MTFQPESDMSQEDVQQRVDEAIAGNEVVLFETVDVLPARDQFRVALNEHSGWETTPQTFVDGEFVGGSDILAELDERGELEATLSGN